jgi:hypothetical protein
MLCCALLLAVTASGFAQTTQRTPTETMREFYRMMREKKFREAFGKASRRRSLKTFVPTLKRWQSS